MKTLKKIKASQQIEPSAKMEASVAKMEASQQMEPSAKMEASVAKMEASARHLDLERRLYLPR
jgi:hypothetical protein